MTSISLLNVDCRDFLAKCEPDSIEAAITDTPYHLTYKENASKGFMENEWDGGRIAFSINLWSQVFKVLKPGGHLLAFGHPRTFYQMVHAIASSGFEIRDTIIWRFNQSMSISTSISKGIDRFRKADRPLVDYKFRGKGRQFAHGHSGFTTGLIEITEPATSEAKEWEGWRNKLRPGYELICLARKPLENGLIKNILDWETGGLNLTAWRAITGNSFNVIYCPKASVRERHAGCEDISRIVTHKGSRLFTSQCDNCGKPFLGTESQRCLCPTGHKKTPETTEVKGNSHPTVKPVFILQALANLVMKPGHTCLDIFAGSGSMGVACLVAGMNCILVEKDQHYFRIAETRVEYAKQHLDFYRELCSGR